MIQLLHTPEGVRDYYNGECARRRNVCDKIRGQFLLYGFQEIQTPVFEYFDIFNAERGSVASRRMYKLFDRDGETLCLRPDFTPQIARCAAKYFAATKMPVKLSYTGNTYVTSSGYRGKLNESMQAGVEFVGDGSIQANAETVALVVDVFKCLELDRFQIEVGDVRYFGGIMDEEGLSPEVRTKIRTYIENKNHFALEIVLEENHVSENTKAVLLELPQMFGDPEKILEKARCLTNNAEALMAVDRLEQFYACMKEYGMDEYISFDLGMLGTQDYYTGIIFKGYTFGTGNEIVSGGRYDNLIAQFGKDAPSIGFGINVDELMQALTSQKIDLPGRPESTLIIYAEESYAAALAEAKLIRSEGRTVHFIFADCIDEKDVKDYITDNHITRIICYAEDGSRDEKEA